MVQPTNWTNHDELTIDHLTNQLKVVKLYTNERDRMKLLSSVSLALQSFVVFKLLGSVKE